MRWLDSNTDSMDMNLTGDSERQAAVLQSMGSHRIRHDLATEQQLLGEVAFCSLLFG